MMRIVFAIPGDLATLTGGYGYDRRVIAELPGCGLEVVHCELPGRFPDPTAADIDESLRRMASVLRDGDVVLMDGLAFGAMPAAAIRAIPAHVIELCHHPLGLEAGLPAERAAALLESERQALAAAAHVVTPSEATRDALARDLGVPRERITIAPPGTDPAPRAKGSRSGCAILAVGSIIPRKAFNLLVEALSLLPDLDWRLSIAGSPARAPQTAAALKRLIEGLGLADRIELLGEISGEALERLYATSDLLVSSSLYEGYGMALAEALARGLPVVTTTGGAAANTVPDAAGLKVPPGDAPALAGALRRVVTDAGLRQRLSDAAWQAGQALPRWRDTAQAIAEAARRIGQERRA